MENIKISVIIPTWNSEKTIEAVIKSCLNQVLPPIEILVCDDGSTDETKNIINKINDERIIWVSSKHIGTPAFQRNNGLKIIKGEWIAFCDSDDEWISTKLQKQIALLKKSKCKASCTNALIKKNSVITSNTVSNWKRKIISFKNLIEGNEIICSSVILHSSIFNEIGGFPEEIMYRGFEDYIYWLRISTKTNFSFINEPLVIYDDHPETSIRQHKISDSLLKDMSFSNFLTWINKSRENRIRIFYFNYLIKLNKIKQKIIFYLKNIIKYLLNIQ